MLEINVILMINYSAEQTARSQMLPPEVHQSQQGPPHPDGRGRARVLGQGHGLPAVHHWLRRGPGQCLALPLPLLPQWRG